MLVLGLSERERVLLELARHVLPRQGLRASDPTLCELLQACYRTPDDPAPFLVLGDWLQQRGDAAGEMIALWLGANRRPSDLLPEYESNVIVFDESLGDRRATCRDCGRAAYAPMAPTIDVQRALLERLRDDGCYAALCRIDAAEQQKEAERRFLEYADSQRRWQNGWPTGR